jgi:hypothetical protein
LKEQARRISERYRFVLERDESVGYHYNATRSAKSIAERRRDGRPWREAGGWSSCGGSWPRRRCGLGFVAWCPRCVQPAGVNSVGSTPTMARAGRSRRGAG